jgi:hypothetical protein
LLAALLVAGLGEVPLAPGSKVRLSVRGPVLVWVAACGNERPQLLAQ